ncbi:unnamed protein product, partial [marine sediment metagenome]
MEKPSKRERPVELSGVSVRKVTGCGNLYVTVTHMEGEEEPFEVFAVLGKAGGCSMAQAEGLCRAISVGLRYGIPVEEFVKQLEGIRCPSPYMWPKEERVLSCP